MKCDRRLKEKSILLQRTAQPDILRSIANNNNESEIIVVTLCAYMCWRAITRQSDAINSKDVICSKGKKRKEKKEKNDYGNVTEIESSANCVT